MEFARFPSGVFFFLFGKGRLALGQGRPAEAVKSYRAAPASQSQYRNLYQINNWELAVAHIALWELLASLECWRRLADEAAWSKACYAYGIAVYLLQLGGEENKKGAAAQFENSRACCNVLRVNQYPWK